MRLFIFLVLLLSYWIKKRECIVCPSPQAILLKFGINPLQSKVNGLDTRFTKNMNKFERVNHEIQTKIDEFEVLLRKIYESVTTLPRAASKTSDELFEEMAYSTTPATATFTTPEAPMTTETSTAIVTTTPTTTTIPTTPLYWASEAHCPPCPLNCSCDTEVHCEPQPQLIPLDEFPEVSFSMFPTSAQSPSGNFTSCGAALDRYKSSGIYNLHVENYDGLIPVYCEANVLGGGWTVILQRLDGSVSFQGNWSHYQQGFGNVGGEYFIGLDKLHALTVFSTQELLVLFEDFDYYRRIARYSDFLVGGPKQSYELLSLGNYTGDAGDALQYSLSMPFSSSDQDNDQDPSNCAETHSPWWHRDCSHSTLFGEYWSTDAHGIYWYEYNESKPLRVVQMMIRPKYWSYTHNQSN